MTVKGTLGDLSLRILKRRSQVVELKDAVTRKVHHFSTIIYPLAASMKKRMENFNREELLTAMKDNHDPSAKAGLKVPPSFTERC